MHAFMNIRTYACMYVCVCIYVYICTCVRLHECKYVRMYACMYVRVYVGVNLHVCTHARRLAADVLSTDCTYYSRWCSGTAFQECAVC
jgi:hypothetical protein